MDIINPSEGAAKGPAPSFRLETIRKRADFLAANSGKRANGPGFTLLHRQSSEPSSALRFGFTVTKKVGTATERNRIRRRLREAVRMALPGFDEARGDFVVLARREALQVEFTALVAGISKAVTLLLAGGGAASRPRR
ncbi:MAG: ribonuclease P protein component [Rhabdaerophilum sp.]